jgi:hypothetical protein
MKVDFEVIYPGVERSFPNPSALEKRFPVVLNIGCSGWKTNTTIRQGFCELLFNGFGNHPGNFDGIPGQPFDSGDPGINNVHSQWAPLKTRSMSVGDLVVIKEINETWLCDNCGWVLLTPEQVKSWLEYPRQYGCCSFEVSDWMKKETGVSL